MHVVAKRGGEQAYPVAAVTEDLISLLEDRHTGPLQISRIDCHIVFLHQDFQPVIETTHHDGAYRTHSGDFLALALTPRQAALDRFSYCDALRQAETNRGVDADA